MCRQRKKTHPPRESHNIKKIKSLHFSSASPVLQPHCVMDHPTHEPFHRPPLGLEILKRVKARFWSKSRKTRGPQNRRFQYKKIAFLTGTRADPGVTLIWGVFGSKLSLQGGSEFPARGPGQGQTLECPTGPVNLEGPKPRPRPPARGPGQGQTLECPTGPVNLEGAKTKAKAGRARARTRPDP